MKIPRLHDIDLARIAPVSSEEKRHRLEQLRASTPPFSYGPLRRSLSDIFNVELGLFGPVAPLPWRQLARIIVANSKTSEEAEANIAVAKALHEYASHNDLTGRHQDFLALPLGEGKKVAYWLPMVLGIEGKAVVPFIDPRRSSKRLGPQARRFVFSVMHERIRAADPDFSDVTLAIFQLDAGEGGARHALLHKDDAVELFDFETLDQMVRETYELWQTICEERATEARRKRGGGGGLFDAA